MFKLEKRGSEADLYIYGAIGDPWDGITAKDVIGAIESAKGTETINVRINSEGGIAFDGLAIMNLLSAAPQTIRVSVDGLAASSASIVAMAGETIEIGSGALMMIHDPWGLALGSASEMRQMAGVLDKIAEQVGDVYAARTGTAVEQIRKMMSAETWMDADEALELGFADTMVDRQLAAASWRLSDFRCVPDMLKRRCRDDDSGCRDEGAFDEVAHAARERQIILTQAACDL